MQNTANQYKRIAIEILRSAFGYLSVFGNCPAKVLVTEILQYSARFCFSNNQQNRENQLILNKLRFICTVLFWLAFRKITYTARHSFATVLKRSGANIAYISESLGHSDLRTTENYLASFEKEEREKNARLLTNFS